VSEPGVKVVRDEFPGPRYGPTPRQQEFFRACFDPRAEEILFDGAIRSGKTQAACKAIASYAWEYGGPNWRFVVMRKTYRELEDSTKAAFLRGDGKMPPACPPQLIARIKKQDELCVLRNGAEILFRSAENPAETEDKLRNVTLAGFFIDQVEELEGAAFYQLYETLLSRCSDPRGPRKALLVANPGPEDHWVHRRFVDPKTAPPYCKRVHVTLEENAWNLPDTYVEKMQRTESTNNMWYRRFILGEWGAFGGKRFQGWDPGLHVVEPFDIDPGWEVVLGIDYGWAHATAAIFCAIDFEGRWWVIGEHYAKELPVSAHARAIKDLQNELAVEPSSIWLDPSTWAKRSEYESPALEFADYGIFAGRAQNDRLGGWNRIDEMLTERMDDGFPRLRIFSTCQNLIRELPSLKIKPGTDDVDKDHGQDDSPDALRYAIMSRMPHPVPRSDEEELPLRERRAKRILERAKARNTQGLVPGL
jgi:PBSX family phage terminase large subunit